MKGKERKTWSHGANSCLLFAVNVTLSPSRDSKIRVKREPIKLTSKDKFDSSVSLKKKYHIVIQDCVYPGAVMYNNDQK